MEIKIPEIGESILEALVSNWLKEDGATVAKDDVICELETDKVNVELNAEASGILHIVVPQGTTVPIGTVIGTLEEGDVDAAASPEPAKQETPAETPPTAPPRHHQGRTTISPGQPRGPAESR